MRSKSEPLTPLAARDWRTFFKDCCHKSAFRLRSQAYRFKDELATKGYVVSLEAVQDTLFEPARDLFPNSPGATFADHAEIIFRDTLARMQEHYTTLTAEQREAADLSRAWEGEEGAAVATQDEDLAGLREALKHYEREALVALEETKKASGAA